MTLTPVASGGELADVIGRINTARDRGDLSDNAALLLKRRLLGQTAAGMAYVQGRRMMHKDLKGENVFVTADGTAKVADFGMAAPGLDAKRSGGTPGYMAPEVTARYTRKGDQDKLPGAGSDVWSMGALMRRELFGTQVLPGTERVWRRTAGRRDKLMRQAVGAPQQDDYRIYRPGRPELTASHLDPMHTELKKVRDVNMLGAQEKLINAMMHPDPEQRPSMQAVAGHAFFNDPMLDEPALQQLTAALIAGAGQQEIRRLGSAVDAIGKRA
jgi:serine/threonine protein kinase